MLEDGRRQILNYILPGDFAGLQGTLLGEMKHSVEALTDMVMCVFEREAFYSLFDKHASLAFDVTWIAAREEQILDELLLSVGRRSALEKLAYILAFLHQRSQRVAKLSPADESIPLNQSHIADTLGFSLVHTNKTIKKLRDRKLIDWTEKGCIVLDEKKLMDIAGWEGLPDIKRPFI